MIGTYTKGRTAVFIDAANIYFSQQSLGWRVDFKKLLGYFRKETNLVRIAFYGALNPENDRERKFHDFLEIIGYTVRHKKVKFIRDKNDAAYGGHRKANLYQLAQTKMHNKDNPRKRRRTSPCIAPYRPSTTT